MTKIEWTTKTWNPIEQLEIPLKTRKPTVWFVNSMSDLLHESVTFESLFEIAAVMLATPQHTYQILTKRPERLPLWTSVLDALHGACKGTMLSPPKVATLPNVWLGVTVENQKTANERRESMEKLAEMGWLTWVSHEPALEQVDFSGWEFIRWLVMGGESGSKARPYELAWPRAVMPWCREHAIAFFHKQLGAFPVGHDGETSIIGKRAMPFGNGSWRRLESAKGNDPEEWPEDLRVREYPAVN